MVNAIQNVDDTRIISVGRRSIQRIQGESRFPWDIKVLQSKSIEGLRRLLLILGGSRAEFVKTIRDKENAVDKRSIGWSFDFEIAEKTVRPEQSEAFIDNVCAVREEVGRPDTCFLRVARRICWAAKPCVEGKKCSIAYFSDICLIQKGRVICLQHL